MEGRRVRVEGKHLHDEVIVHEGKMGTAGHLRVRVRVRVRLKSRVRVGVEA